MSLKIHFSSDFDMKLAPVQATKMRDWWEDNQKTSNHAKHCLPLQMANSLGYYILSPGTFIVKWNGDIHANVEITHIDKSSHYEVDNHAAFGSFTVQPKFIPVTDRVGDFVYVKGIPNERSSPYTCMEAAIESWWSVANFGLVFLLNKPGEFLIPIGKPIAQMFVYRGSAGAIEPEFVAGYPSAHYEWLKRRSRPSYVKDLDYFGGKTSDGSDVPSHITNWKLAKKYE